MTALVTLSCDRMRHGQPCTSGLVTGQRSPLAARLEALRDGWGSALVDLPDGAHAYLDTCPSNGHDDQEQP